MRLFNTFLKSISAVLIVCLLSLALSAQTVGTSITSGITTPGKDSALPTGILDATNINNVLVNGNRAKDGMTVLSGTDLEVMQTDASIKLNNLGNLRICPQTKLNLTFNNGQVDIRMLTGSISLETLQGVNGQIIMPNDTVIKSKESGVLITPNYGSGCRSNALAAAPLALPTASFWSSFTTAASVIGGAVTLAAVRSAVSGGTNSLTSISLIQP